LESDEIDKKVEVGSAGGVSDGNLSVEVEVGSGKSGSKEVGGEAEDVD
jgi:hypothetical protein